MKFNRPFPKNTIIRTKSDAVFCPPDSNLTIQSSHHNGMGFWLHYYNEDDFDTIGPDEIESIVKLGDDGDIVYHPRSHPDGRHDIHVLKSVTELRRSNRDVRKKRKRAKEDEEYTGEYTKELERKLRLSQNRLQYVTKYGLDGNGAGIDSDVIQWDNPQFMSKKKKFISKKFGVDPDADSGAGADSDAKEHIKKLERKLRLSENRLQFLTKYGLDGNGAGLDSAGAGPGSQVTVPYTPARTRSGEESSKPLSIASPRYDSAVKCVEKVLRDYGAVDDAADSVKWTVEDCNGSKAVCCGKRMPSEIHLQVGKEQSNVISAAAAEGANSVKINQCVVRL